MIFIRTASAWNPHDFIAAKVLREEAGAPPITWREHFHWWRKGGYQHLYLLHSNRRRIGYVRADFIGRVSIAVDPQYQRAGYGLALLHHLRREVRGFLIAYILIDNAASIALFKKAGYHAIVFTSQIPSRLIMVNSEN